MARDEPAARARAVAEQEWPAMRNGRRSPVVDGWIADYRDLFNRFDLGAARERLGFQALLAEASQRTDGRRERLSQVTPSVPSPLWLVLVLGACVTVALQLGMADRRERLLVQGAMIGAVATIVTAGLPLVNFLDHPYQRHAGSIEPTEMRQSLAMMREAALGLATPCRSDGRPLM